MTEKKVDLVGFQKDKRQDEKVNGWLRRFTLSKNSLGLRETFNLPFYPLLIEEGRQTSTNPVEDSGEVKIKDIPYVNLSADKTPSSTDKNSTHRLLKKVRMESASKELGHRGR